MTVSHAQLLAAIQDLTYRVNAGLITQDKALAGIDAAVDAQRAADDLILAGVEESLRQTVESLAQANALLKLDEDTIAALQAEIVALQERVRELEGDDDPPAGTLFGWFAGPRMYPNNNPVEYKADMRARCVTAFGCPPPVERIFNEGTWTVPAAGIPAIVSFSQDPVRVAAGDFDEDIRTFVEALDPNTTYWLCLNHECDQTTRPYTAAGQVAGFQRFAAAVRTFAGPNVKLATILMSWTLTQGSPDHWRDWYPGPEYVDALGWDAYWRPSIPHTVEDIYGKAYAVTQAEGKDFLICETSIGAQGHGGQMADGSPVPEDVRTAFVTDAIAYLKGRAAAVTWFETNKTDGNWLLEGHPALELWAAAAQASV